MPGIRETSGRANALKRYRPPDDPVLLDAERDLHEAQLAEYITRTVTAMPPLEAEQRARLAILLLTLPAGAE
jgi:hypothetical protein